MVSITTFLWFDGRAGEAADFYLSVFPEGRMVETLRAPVDGNGDARILSVTFDLMGQRYVAFNGGPHFSFTPAVSLFVGCDTQDEVDHFWERLSEGGAPQQCGWLKDRFGLSWQVVPRLLGTLIGDEDRTRAGRVMLAMRGMVKIDMAGLHAAYEGPAAPDDQHKEG